MPRKSEQFIPYNEQAVRKVAMKQHDVQTAYVIQGVHGLMLTCFPSGTATYSVRYTVKGKRHKESIGKWGVVDLSEARAKALEVAAGAAKDLDVLAVEAQEKTKFTLQELWEERVRRDTTRAARTMNDYGRYFELDVFATFGSKRAADITSDEYADLLREIEDRSKHAARHIRCGLSSLYRWAQKQRLVKTNPIVVLGFSTPGKPRTRVLTDIEMRKLWGSIDTTRSLVEPMRNILRLAILTGQRNSEVAGMEVAELIGLDTQNPRWQIPARRMKRKTQDQHVPLSSQAVRIIKMALTSSSNGVHVFQGSTKGRVGGKWRQDYISQKSVSHAMGRVVANAGLKDVHLHDMRKCITTWLAEHGHATPEILDAILHHGKKGVTGTHYNFALYERQVRSALQTWADHVDKVAASKAGNVVELAAARA